MANVPPELKPLKDNLLVLEIKEEMSKGGIALPDNHKMTGSNKGVILAIGPGMTMEDSNGNIQIPDWVEEGDIVIYPLGAGRVFNYDGSKYTVVAWRSCDVIVSCKPTTT